MDYVLVDGDKAIFLPSFGAATVVVQPGTLRASGPATLSKQKLCVAGDEKSVSVPGCMYTTPTHSIPGTGTLEISALAGSACNSLRSSRRAGPPCRMPRPSIRAMEASRPPTPNCV